MKLSENGPMMHSLFCVCEHVTDDRHPRNPAELRRNQQINPCACQERSEGVCHSEPSSGAGELGAAGRAPPEGPREHGSAELVLNRPPAQQGAAERVHGASARRGNGGPGSPAANRPRVRGPHPLCMRSCLLLGSLSNVRVPQTPGRRNPGSHPRSPTGCLFPLPHGLGLDQARSKTNRSSCPELHEL